MNEQMPIPGTESLEAELTEVAATAPGVEIAENEAIIAAEDDPENADFVHPDYVDIGAAVKRLVQKAENWVLLQPEYPLVFLLSRPARRRFSRELAHILTTIPRRRGV